MTQYNTLNVKSSNLQLEKLKSGARYFDSFRVEHIPKEI